MCVDDEETPLVLRKFVLRKAGYEVITARSATEALELMSSRQVDLVLTDHLMPGVTGTELAKQIKAQHPSTRVLLLSGVNEIPEESDAADAFLSKVEGADALCRRVAALLRGSGRS